MRLAADDPGAIHRAVGLLDAGELVVIPTGSEYALACDALHEDAIDRLRAQTQRAADRPIPIVVAGFEDAHHVAFPTPIARQLAEAFWPGPVALVQRARPWLPDAITAGADTIALRCPAHTFARELARHFGPLAATKLSAWTPDAATLTAGASSLVVDGGAGKPISLTVVDATGSSANVLREGHVGPNEIAEHGRVRH